LAASDVDVVSSAELGRLTGFSSEQIRKDLAYFGAFGTRGVGYSTAQLARRIERILGFDRPILAALVGAGNLGTALIRYNSSRDQDVLIKAVFDDDPSKVGTLLEGIRVTPTAHLETVVRSAGIRMGIIAVPASVAQEVAKRMVKAGVTALLNFAPVSLKVPEGVFVRDVDLTIELQSLAYYTVAADP